MGSMQRRHGPNVLGFFGLLQPIADGIKLVFSEILFPRSSNRLLYLLAPFITFICSFLNWLFINFSYGNYLVDSQYSLLYIYIIMSISVYGIILAGWISKSRYSFLGAIRSTAQMLSYEISLSLSFLMIIIYSQSTNLIDIVNMQIETLYFGFVLPLVLVITFISLLAETNRTPFDLPEAEAELVAGYNLEYSSLPFALFFLAEYANMLSSSALLITLFFGGWDSSLMFFSNEFVFVIKCSIIWFLFILIRSTMPRYRFDQLITINWTVFLPILISSFWLYTLFGLIWLSSSSLFFSLGFDLWKLILTILSTFCTNLIINFLILIIIIKPFFKKLYTRRRVIKRR